MMTNEETEGLKRAEEYSSKGRFSEAISELEGVLRLNDKNMMAHKMLAETCCRNKDIDRAVEEYEAILRLNPEDRASRTMRDFLTSYREHQDIDVKEADTGGENDVPVYEINGNINASELGIERPQRLVPVKEGPASREVEEFRKIMKEFSRDGLKETFKDRPTPAMEEKLEPKEKYMGGHDSQRAGQDVDKIVISMPTKTMADILVSQGCYEKAMDVYNEMLAADPENKKLIQRREELKMLIKIMEKKNNRR
jgi:pentatricopeptide repeat protein